MVSPHCIALEQVVGFQSHPRKPAVIRILKWLGYRIVFEKVVDLAGNLHHAARDIS